jgi:hypothetical protein
LRPLASQGRDIAHDAQNLSSQRALIDRLTIR